MDARRRKRKAEALGSLERFQGMPEHVEQLYAERARAIREAFEAGAGVTAIARRLGLDRTIVYRAIQNGKGEA